MGKQIAFPNTPGGAATHCKQHGGGKRCLGPVGCDACAMGGVQARDPEVSSQELETRIRNGFSSIASTTSQWSTGPSHSKAKLTPLDAHNIADDLEHLIQQCTAMKKSAEQLRSILAEEEDARVREEDRRDAARKGQFKPVKVPKDSPVWIAAKHRIINSVDQGVDRGVNPTIWQCSGAGADGVCKHGTKQFEATPRLGNVKAHIERVHESTREDRQMKGWGELAHSFVVA